MFCEDVELEGVAKEVGTPFYIYNANEIDRRVQAFKEAVEGLNCHIGFAVKANSNLAVLDRIFKNGCGADIVSGGELARALKAGCHPGHVVFSGVGKSVEEMKFAIEQKIMMFQVESENELEILNQVASSMGAKANVSLRINPDVESKTHPYIGTGSSQNKFGISVKKAFEIYLRANEMKGINIVGIGCHIGSQLPSLEPLGQAIGQLCELALSLKEKNIDLKYFDVGGGLPIDYGEESHASLPNFSDYGAMLKNALKPIEHLKCKIVFEPGRVLVGPIGMLVTKVLYPKQGESKKFVIVDAAMNDLLRPSLYQAHHPIMPLKEGSQEKEKVDVVGPVCESGDFFAKDRLIPKVEAGDLLGIGASGAYGFTMASTYNSRPTVAEVLVDGSQYAVIRPRQQVAELFESETIPVFS